MNKKYLIINNYSNCINSITYVVNNYIKILYKNNNNLFFFKKILIITFNLKNKKKIIYLIIKKLNSLYKRDNKTLLLTKYLHNKFNISYLKISYISKKILNNIFFYYNKLPIYTIYYLINFLYSKNYNFNYNNYLFRNFNKNIINNNIIYNIINLIFKKKKKIYKYIIKFLYNKIYVGFFKITNIIKKKIKNLLVTDNYNINILNFHKIKKKIIYYINQKKKIVKKLKNIKNKFYFFLYKKKINKKYFIYNDINKIFEKKINFLLFKKVYINKAFLNNRLIKNLNNNVFYSKKVPINQKENINKYKYHIKKYIYRYNNIINNYAFKYINFNKLIDNYIVKFFIRYIYKKHKFNLYKKNKGKGIYISISNIYNTLFIYEYHKLNYYQYKLLKFLFNNIIYEGNKIYLWGNFKKIIYKDDIYNFIKIKKKLNKIYINYNITLEKNIRYNYTNDSYIVRFNNNLFSFINKNLINNKEYKKIYNNSTIQLSNKKDNGYVEINIIKKKNLYKVIINYIIKLFKIGYKYKDIIIIVKNRQEIEDYIKNLNLNKNNINFQNVSYIYNIIYVKILIEFLKIYSNKNTKYISKYYINFILLLNKIKHFKKIKIKKKILLFNFNLFLKYLKKYKIYIYYNFFKKLNIYQKVEYLIDKLKFNISILSEFLNIIIKYEDNYNINNLHSFLNFWYNNKKNFINNNYSDYIKILSINNNKNIISKITILPFLNFNIFYNSKRTLNDILFNKIISKNNIKNIINNKQISNFNILYNFTTRAIKKLIILLTKNNNKFNIYFLFKNFLKKINLWKKKKLLYTFGKNNKKVNKINNYNKFKLEFKTLPYNKINKYINYIKLNNLYNLTNNKKYNFLNIKNYLKKNILLNKKFKFIKLEFNYKKKIFKYNNIIKINNKIYFIKYIKYKKNKIDNIINFMYNKNLLFKNIYKLKNFCNIILFINKNKIKYIYKIII